MSDISCPYCKAEQEIDHDDGHGYEEDKIHNQQCGECDKYFTFTTSIIYHYDVHESECLNGGEHKWEDVVHYPKTWNWKRCEDCGEDKREALKKLEEMEK